ncbi:SirB1 family protein [Aeromonas rivuli]|jgi:regulator of sirC expression with transglutaminase-like and TPR domain|uniref:SirB1 family protein n=1 Tax=Aeromonas TaxID=642 RepID=UPI0005A647BF|nr:MULTISPECIES: tetratricopeptide repeat protein [Aeromonas]MCS3455072.1 regulator of sirC expression with transglutaminase-like and TPR domain [Aeromonas sp. BIGb0405]MCS3458050.1 regulator of sirC expression with transglutaminase-like and TPR domain [Aeromonas sp. BIGb0445]UBO73188.1 tetratricopeptide repeat protein [Aeromonas rivuli]
MFRIDEWTDFEAQDLVLLALSVSEEINQHDGEGSLRELELLDEWLNETLQEGTADEVRTQLIHGFYQSLGFHGDWQDFFSSGNSDIATVLTRRQGIPVSLGILLIQLGRRVGLDVEGICFPGYFLVSFAGDEGEVYVDPFNGEVLSHHRIELLLRGSLGDLAALKPDHLQPSGQWEIIERLINVSKSALLRENRMAEALRASELLLRMKPGDPLETRDRGFIYEQLDCPRFAADDFEYFIEQCPDDPVADVLKMQLAALDLSPKPLH